MSSSAILFFNLVGMKTDSTNAGKIGTVACSGELSLSLCASDKADI